MRTALRRFVRRALGRPSRKLIAGPPPGLELQDLDEVCWRERGCSVRSLSHAHLSAWKESGSFLVSVVDANGGKWSVVFKRADYQLSEIPALDGFSLRPGPPEYRVLTEAVHVRPHLPRVLLARETRPGEQFLYLIEDLSTSHRVAAGPDCVRCAAFLPTLQRELADDFAQSDDALLRFDGPFWERLLPYADESLRRFEPTHPERGALALAELLPALDGLRQRVLEATASSNEDARIVAVHGDYNLSNILVPRRGGELKVVDWEWCGFGLPHADLASLLKGIDRKTETAALTAFSERLPSTPERRHLELYRWCQIERGVLDAAYLARQATGTQHATGLDFPSCIESSFQLVSRYRAELLP